MAASTQNQALSALLFLYRDVLEQELPWLDDIVRAKNPERIPVVLTREEVQAVIDWLDGPTRLLYGAGLPEPRRPSAPPLTQPTRHNPQSRNIQVCVKLKENHGPMRNPAFPKAAPAKLPWPPRPDHPHQAAMRPNYPDLDTFS